MRLVEVGSTDQPKTLEGHSYLILTQMIKILKYLPFGIIELRFTHVKVGKQIGSEVQKNSKFHFLHP